jgi:hypothetical protein
VKVIGSFLLAGIAVEVLPRVSSGGTQPPVGTLLAVGILVGGLTSGALYLGISRDMKLPARVAIFFVAYNALIVLVKFVLAPAGLYQVNRERWLRSTFGQRGIVWLSAAVVLVLYAMVFSLLYLGARRSLGSRLTPSKRDRGVPRKPSLRKFVIGLIVVVAVVVGLSLLALLTVLGGGGLQYLDFVFSSGLSLLIAVALGLASVFVVMGFRSVEDRTRAVADATVLLNLFWLGLAFLLLFHVLWVIYVLVLTSIWPLKTVVPK